MEVGISWDAVSECLIRIIRQLTWKEFSELTDIPQTTISLTAADRLQSIGNGSAHTDSCNCRAILFYQKMSL